MWPRNSGGGTTADTGISAIASMAIPANRLVYVMGDGRLALADGIAEGKEAVGFTKEAAAEDDTGTFFTTGTMSDQSGLAPGQAVFMTTTPGIPGEAPTATGNVVMRVGTAISTTDLSFDIGTPVTL